MQNRIILVPLPGLGNSKMRHRKGFLGNFSIARRTFSDGVVNGTNGTRKQLFYECAICERCGRNVTNVTLFSIFWGCNIWEFWCPNHAKPALFFNGMGQMRHYSAVFPSGSFASSRLSTPKWSSRAF